MKYIFRYNGPYLNILIATKVGPAKFENGFFATSDEKLAERLKKVEGVVCTTASKPTPKVEPVSIKAEPKEPKKG